MCYQIFTKRMPLSFLQSRTKNVVMMNGRPLSRATQYVTGDSCETSRSRNDVGNQLFTQRLVEKNLVLLVSGALEFLPEP